MPFTTETVNSNNLTYVENTIAIKSLMLSDGGMYECIIHSDAFIVPHNCSVNVAVIDGMCTCSFICNLRISVSYTIE